jgi:hypothetical protein
MIGLPLPSALKPELHASLEAEVALTVVTVSEVIAKAGQIEICIHQRHPDMLIHHDVNATTDDHRETHCSMEKCWRIRRY